MRREDSLRCIKGIGEKTERLFQKLGIFTVGDLLEAYPREYDCCEAPVKLAELVPDTKAAVEVMLPHSAEAKGYRNKSVVTLSLSDKDAKLTVTWFNMPFLRSTLKRGSVFVFRGRVVKKSGRLVMEQPEIFTPAAYEEHLHALQPVYALTAGLPNKTVVRTVAAALKERTLEQEFMPDDIRERYGLAEYNYAVSQVHFPADREHLTAARRRLIFDEFLFFILALQRLKETQEVQKNSYSMKQVWKTEEVMESLPYRLTGAQMRVWTEIENDLKGSTLGARLVQGDVGSGKTILAFLAMIMSAENGYQSALMVPTEVLAKQHYESLLKLLEEHDLGVYSPVLLTGSTRAKEKREIYEKIASGEAKMIIGTHALIQEKVEYHSLALVITDEQHRFGVRQRITLSDKGKQPNVLVMSATPIPRTLAIILYGDLDISVVDELPAKRLPIKNCVVDTSYRPKAYRFMEKEIAAGHQVYVICPMVEESEGLEAENVTDYTQKLRQVFPPEIAVEALHGQMKPAQKNEIMERFAANEIQILVSTTVVEVGVNVPNATVMMVENAERFGLAQLHQLRGRVGRGDAQSYCIFMQGSGAKETSRRLEILNKSNDGFFIASEDLKLRGPGDLFGERQSGLMEFAIADIYRDAAILKQASDAARELLELDPDLSLPQNERLKQRLDAYCMRRLEDLGL